MPLRKSSASLKLLCLNAIAHNMDYWCENYIEHFMGSKTLYIISPFDCLPNEMLLALLSVLKQQTLLKRPHLDLIVHSRFESLNLSNTLHLDFNYLINLIGRSVKNLRFLDISYCNKISRSSFLELPLVIPNILVLKMQSTNCFDGVLARIGGHCHAIRELDISWCPISDVGVSSLCVNMDEISPGTPRCQKLEILSLVGTKVTTIGAICVLRHLPLLKKFYFFDVMKALEIIHVKDFEENCIASVKKYLLQILNISSESNYAIRKEIFTMVAQLCPEVTAIEITNVNIDKNYLSRLGQFKKIQDLSLINSDEGSINFDEDLSPFLQLNGDILLNLSLAEISKVDVNFIGYCCPNLQKLKVIFSKSYSSVSYTTKQKTVFENLRDLQIVCNNGNEIPPYQLNNTFMNSLLIENIFLQTCNALDDDMLINLLSSNPLKCIKQLEFEYCDGLTARGISALLHLSNPLHTLIMTWCKNITRMDYESFQKMIERENLNIMLQWT